MASNLTKTASRNNVGRASKKAPAKKAPETKAKIKADNRANAKAIPVVSKPETDADVEKRINERFAVMEALVDGVTRGEHRGMIISGPPGVSKTYTVLQRMHKYDDKGPGYNWNIDTGYMRATGLYRRLFEYRRPGQVIILDDIDAVFNDEAGLNILKAATDTVPERYISWGSEYQFSPVNGEAVPSRFLFEGGIIFITNLDFDKMIAEKHRYAKHFEALMSRVHYLDLSMKTRRDCLIRVKSLVKSANMLKNKGLTPDQEATVLGYMNANIESLREVSLRTAVRIADQIKVHKDESKWKPTVDVTFLRRTT